VIRKADGYHVEADHVLFEFENGSAGSDVAFAVLSGNVIYLSKELEGRGDVMVLDRLRKQASLKADARMATGVFLRIGAATQSAPRRRTRVAPRYRFLESGCRLRHLVGWTRSSRTGYAKGSAMIRLLAVLALFGALALAQDTRPAEDEVTYRFRVRHIEISENVVYLVENVEFRIGVLNLRADTVVVWLAEGAKIEDLAEKPTPAESSLKDWSRLARRFVKRSTSTATSSYGKAKRSPSRRPPTSTSNMIAGSFSMRRHPTPSRGRTATTSD
jgi:lipopolysaccharide export system protein LptA